MNVINCTVHRCDKTYKVQGTGVKEIARDVLIQLLKEKFPKFIPYWKNYVNECDGVDLGISNDMTPFSDFAVNEIKSENFNEIENIFILVEFLMYNGNNSVKDAIATCFLENLLNKDPEKIQFIKFRQYLGKETIAYCRAWDIFTGVITKGLHDD